MDIQIVAFHKNFYEASGVKGYLTTHHPISVEDPSFEKRILDSLHNRTSLFFIDLDQLVFLCTRERKYFYLLQRLFEDGRILYGVYENRRKLKGLEKLFGQIKIKFYEEEKRFWQMESATKRMILRRLIQGKQRGEKVFLYANTISEKRFWHQYASRPKLVDSQDLSTGTLPSNYSLVVPWKNHETMRKVLEEIPHENGKIVFFSPFRIKEILKMSGIKKLFFDQCFAFKLYFGLC